MKDHRFAPSWFYPKLCIYCSGTAAGHLGAGGEADDDADADDEPDHQPDDDGRD